MAAGQASENNRVVVIEADDLIRDLIWRWLADAGYEVAASGAEPPIALVIANVPNPGQADALVSGLKARYAGAPVLAISAPFSRSLAASEDVARRLGVRKVLPKPFTGEELLAAVEESLRER